MDEATSTDAPGRIVTFYSYKGGVGRSMALANIAVMLARDYGLKVVAVDWDLEAPGLHRYFGISDADAGPGVINYFTNYKRLVSLPPDESEICEDDLDIRRFARVIEEYEGGGSIQLISAGDQGDSASYVDDVSGFDWDDFYRNWTGAHLIEAVRGQLAQLGDAILIDSRTGITDTGGICTLHLPDIIVLVFVFNSQNLDGIARIAGQISGENPALAITKRSPDMLFLPSRKDTGEIEQLREWEEKAVELFRPYMVSPRIIERFGDDALEYLRQASVPYVPFFAYGEELAARTDKGYEMSTPLGVLAQMVSDRSPTPRPGGGGGSGLRPIGSRANEVQPELFERSLLMAPPRPSASGAPVAQPVQAAREEISPVPKASPPQSTSRPWIWAGFGLAVSALVGTAYIKSDSWFTRDPGVGSSSPTGEASGETPDLPESATDTQTFELGLLRAEVRFDYLAFYAEAAPTLVDNWQCELALGTPADATGWAREWPLQPVEIVAGATRSERLPGLRDSTAASVRRFSYEPFEAHNHADEEPALLFAQVADLGMQARVVGPASTPDWLSTAWSVAEARGMTRARAEVGFRELYGIAEDEDLSVDVAPVVASMELTYAKQSLATLHGWVARVPGSSELIVNFVVIDTMPTAMAISLQHRIAHAKWLEKLQGVGVYSEGGAEKRTYQVSIEGPVDALDDIVRVSYTFPDGSVESSAKAADQWEVEKARRRCEGQVSIEIERSDGARLPLVFAWCDDAVRKSSPNSSIELERTRCDGKLIAKNPGEAVKICKQEYAEAKSDSQRSKAADHLWNIYDQRDDLDNYCHWLEIADGEGSKRAKREASADPRSCRSATQEGPSVPWKNGHNNEAAPGSGSSR